MEDLQATGERDLPETAPLESGSELPLARGDDTGDVYVTAAPLSDFEDELPLTRGDETEPDSVTPTPPAEEEMKPRAMEKNPTEIAEAEVVSTNLTAGISWAPLAWIGGLIVLLGAGVVIFLGRRGKSS